MCGTDIQATDSGIKIEVDLSDVPKRSTNVWTLADLTVALQFHGSSLDTGKQKQLAPVNSSGVSH